MAGGPHPQLLFFSGKCILLLEKEMLCPDIPPEEAPLALLVSYYIAYPSGCYNLCLFLEILLLDMVPKKIPPKVSSLFTALQSF